MTSPRSNTIAWLKATGARAARTAAQVAVLRLGAAAADEGIDVTAVPWDSVLAYSIGGAVLAVLTAIAWPPPEAKDDDHA